jgi:hypothetical protein
MQLHLEENTYIVNKKETDPKKFSLSNESLLIGMYRDKIYKNKLRIVPQEYMCNARDAHREKGNAHIPIEVTLPSVLEPTLRIKDYGVGIDDERIKIFSQYGESTKRSSDKETGGFGVGCKCAWSYSESFTIETVYATEIGQKIKRIYSLYITSKLDPGNYRIVSDKVVSDDEETGTTVIIPIMENDIENIIKSVFTTCKFWDVKPIIHGEYTKPTLPAVITDNGTYLSYQNLNLYAITSRMFVILDGICYNIDPELLVSGKSQYERIDDDNVVEVKYNVDEKHKSIFSSRVALKFNTEDLEVSPDRENLDYNVKTISAIRDRIQEIVKIMTIKLDDFIKNNNSRYDVYSYYKSLEVRISYMYNEHDLYNIVKQLSSLDALTVSYCQSTQKGAKSESKKFDFEKAKNAVIISYSEPSKALEKRYWSKELFEQFGCQHFILLTKHRLNDTTISILTHDVLKVKKPQKPRLPRLAKDKIDLSTIDDNTYFVRTSFAQKYITNGDKQVTLSREIFSKLKSKVIASNPALKQMKIVELNLRDQKILSKHKVKPQFIDSLIIKLIDKYNKDIYRYSDIRLDLEINNFLKKYRDELMFHFDKIKKPLMKRAIDLYIKYYDKGRYAYTSRDLTSVSNSLGMTCDKLNLDFLEGKIKSINFLKLRNIKDEEFVKNIIRSYNA